MSINPERHKLAQKIALIIARALKPRNLKTDEAYWEEKTKEYLPAAVSLATDLLSRIYIKGFSDGHKAQYKFNGSMMKDMIEYRNKLMMAEGLKYDAGDTDIIDDKESPLP